MKNEIIIECGVEGGLRQLLGQLGAHGGWRFRTVTDEGTLKDFIDPKDGRVDRPWARQCRPRDGNSGDRPYVLCCDPLAIALTAAASARGA
jgi:hypothetical protein